MPLPNLLIADLSHALNGEEDATVTVETVDYAVFTRLEVETLGEKKEPGIAVTFEKDGRRYVAHLSLYDGRELEDDVPCPCGDICRLCDFTGRVSAGVARRYREQFPEQD